jgi:hypothetical protein
MEGQINLGTPFGNEIYNICKNTTYKTFCEIGTWNGRGTTRCVVQAIIDKENSEHNIFWSVEADPKFYDLAVNFYSDKYNSFLHLLKGTVNTKGVMTREEVQNHPLFQSIYGHYVLHYDTEYNSFKNSEYVGNRIGDNIDVAILDGGEFSTEGDFDFFRNRNVKVFILDDVNVIKCSRIRQELLQNPEYRLYKEDLSDRNGWSIFMKNI